jgi:hypothetical protein
MVWSRFRSVKGWNQRNNPHLQPFKPFGAVRKGCAVFVPPHDKAAEYRRRAQEARDLAQQISLKDVKRHLLETAKNLEILAEAEERRAREAGPPFPLKPEPR